jgi:hypothetical protein
MPHTFYTGVSLAILFANLRSLCEQFLRAVPLDRIGPRVPRDTAQGRYARVIRG